MCDVEIVMELESSVEGAPTASSRNSFSNPECSKNEDIDTGSKSSNAKRLDGKRRESSLSETKSKQSHPGFSKDDDAIEDVVVEWETKSGKKSPLRSQISGGQDGSHECVMDIIIPGHRVSRPPKAFTIFAQEHWRILASQNPQESNKQINTILRNMWSNLINTRKEEYRHKAELAEVEYKQKYPDYVYKLQEARRKRKEQEVQFKLLHKNFTAVEGADGDVLSQDKMIEQLMTELANEKSTTQKLENDRILLERQLEKTNNRMKVLKRQFDELEEECSREKWTKRRVQRDLEDIHEICDGFQRKMSAKDS